MAMIAGDKSSMKAIVVPAKQPTHDRLPPWPSTIESNHATQAWEVKDNEATILFTDPSRSACLQWERRHFNAN